MVAADGQNQNIEPASENQPIEALESRNRSSSPAPPQEATQAPRLTYPEQPTGRVMDLMV